MMLKLETYLMDLKHNITEHLRVILVVIRDMKVIGNNHNGINKYLLLVTT